MGERLGFGQKRQEKFERGKAVRAKKRITQHKRKLYQRQLLKFKTIVFTPKM